MILASQISMPHIIQIKSVEEAEAVSDAAKADNHYVIGPTHYWKDKDGKIQGYFSVGVIPVCHFWMRRDSSPRESLETIKVCEGLVKERIEKEGLPRYGIIACHPESPFYPLLEKHVEVKPIQHGLSLFGKSFSRYY